MIILREKKEANDNFQNYRFCNITVFSVTRRSRSDESHSLTDLLTYWVDVSIDFTDVTLVSDDTYRRLFWCDPDDPDDPDESYLVMKVI